MGDGKRLGLVDLKCGVPQSAVARGRDLHDLGSEGGLLTLSDGLGIVVESFIYDDAGAWPTQPDGNGPSLERISTALVKSSPTDLVRRASPVDPKGEDDPLPGSTK